MSYFVNCSAEKAVRYDREQVEKDGTEFSHLQVVLASRDWMKLVISAKIPMRISAAGGCLLR